MDLPTNDSPNEPIELQEVSLGQKWLELVFKVMTPSGGMISGLGAYILLPIDSEPAKLSASFAIGAGITLIGKFLKPISQATQTTAEDLGIRATKVAARLSEKAIAEITNVDDRYRVCQAAACETITTEGLITGKLGGLFTPMLDLAYVQLELDRGAQLPGLCAQEICVQDPEFNYPSTTVDIWKLLAVADRDRTYRQIAILAWGGFGKTTLLRHLALKFGNREQPDAVQPWLPVLLLLRKYRGILTQENPPSLAELITQDHFLSLPVTNDVTLPDNWAQDRLKKGQMLIMIDGFDEVPQEQRGQVARWINQQVSQFGRSLFIVTSRPKAYTEQSGEHRIDFNTVLWVREFNDHQRQKFIQQWYWCQEYYSHGKEDRPIVRQLAQRAAEDLYSQIKQRPELADLSKNPLLLNMLAVFHRCNPKIDIPKRRTDVFQGICQLWLKDRPEARGLDLGVEDWENAQIALQQLALAMMNFPEPRIEKKKLLKHFKSSLIELEESISAQDFLEKIEQISEMLIQREADEYEFPHNSFQEFLAAKEIVRLEQEAILQSHFGEDKWKPMTLLYAGITKKPSRLIRAALNNGFQDLAYELRQETRRRLDDDLSQELNEKEDLIQLDQTVVDARFKNLQALLENQQWKDADYETYRLMITTIGKEEGQLLESEDFRQFPCEDLQKLDQLWVNYSDGKWGFSVQKSIWEECGRPASYNDDWIKFCKRVGWIKEEKWLNYSELTFNLENTSPGEFPLRVYGLYNRKEMVLGSLLSRKDL